MHIRMVLKVVAGRTAEITNGVVGSGRQQEACVYVLTACMCDDLT